MPEEVSMKVRVEQDYLKLPDVSFDSCLFDGGFSDATLKIA